MRSSTSSSSHARSTWSVPFRPREDGAWTTTGRRRLDGGAGATAFRSMPGGITRCLGHPADRVEAADDLGAGLLPVRELLGRLAADVRAEVVHDRALAKRAQNRKLERLRDERQPEREVEQVGCRQELAEHLPLRHLSAEQASVELERPVGLRVQRVAVEDDELRVDPAAAERLHVRPRHTRRVDRAVDDAERAASHRAPGSVPGED